MDIIRMTLELGKFIFVPMLTLYILHLAEIGCNEINLLVCTTVLIILLYLSERLIVIIYSKTFIVKLRVSIAGILPYIGITYCLSEINNANYNLNEIITNTVLQGKMLVFMYSLYLFEYMREIKGHINMKLFSPQDGIPIDVHGRYNVKIKHIDDHIIEKLIVDKYFIPELNKFYRTMP